MTTHAPPTSLSAFLLACLTDDEAAALAALEPDEFSGERPRYYSSQGPHRDDWGLWTFHVDPARVLANVAALRAVVAIHRWVEIEPGLDRFMDLQAEFDASMSTLRALAQPFAGREGWQEAWGE